MKRHEDTSPVRCGARPNPWLPIHSCFLPLSLNWGVGSRLLIDAVCRSSLSSRCYLITHSHLDHVNGLVLSAGSMGGQKSIHARKQTIKDLEVIFADRLWPKLASHKKEDANAMLVYSP
jgi:hypothetical protein